MNDSDYHRKRAAQEFNMGCRAKDRRAAAAHYQLFAMHSARFRSLAGIGDHCTDYELHRQRDPLVSQT